MYKVKLNYSYYGKTFCGTSAIISTIGKIHYVSDIFKKKNFKKSTVSCRYITLFLKTQTIK